MSYPDNVNITIDGVTSTLTLVNQDKYGSEYRYRGALEEIQLFIRHEYSDDSTRHNAMIKRTIYPTDTEGAKTHTVSATVREPSLTDPQLAKDLQAGFVTFLGDTNNSTLIFQS
uniref:Uncharacterized protein n=1 Tax=Beihai levi-like virus 4 TaxID=1922422 RepID=A0A1L3KI70_9VIRU|nr:hypothetical protein [Beihai levi-like virus 4]